MNDVCGICAGLGTRPTGDTCYACGGRGVTDAPERTPRVCPECRQTEDCELRLEAEVERLRAAIRDGHTIEKEPDGTVVVYGNPKPEHNCDEMGCPSIRHVLLVLPALTKSEGE